MFTFMWMIFKLIIRIVSVIQQPKNDQKGIVQIYHFYMRLDLRKSIM